MTEPVASPNEFEQGKTGTRERTRAEALVEGVRLLGGVFVGSVRASRMAMAIIDPNLPGNPIVFANRSFLDLSGYTMEEVLGQQPHFLNGAGTDPKDAQRFAAALLDDHDDLIETVQYRKDGSAFAATVVLSAFKDDEGQTLHHFVVWTDIARRVDADSQISELRKSQEALRKCEAELHAFLAASEDVIYRMSPDWSEMRDLRGKNFLADTTTPSTSWMNAYLNSADQWTVGEVIRQAIATKSVLEMEHQVLRADGTVGWVYSRAVPILGERGEIVEWIGSAKDVSERRQTEDVLRASEEKYRSLFESIGQGFCELELIRDAEGRAVDQLYLELNPAFERIFGIPVAEAKGRKASEIFPALDPVWTEAFDRVASTRSPERLEHSFGPGRWFQVFAYPGKNDRVTVLYEEVTERKQAEQALRESEKRQGSLLKFADALRAETTPQGVADCAIRMLSDAMQPDRCYVATYRVDDDRADITHQVGTERISPLPDQIRLSDFPEALREALDRTLVIDDVRGKGGLSETDRQSFWSLGFGALIAATLQEGPRRPVWSIVAVSAKPRTWSRADIALVEDVAERTWAAMERVRNEHALRESEARLVSAFETVPVGVAVIDLSGYAVMANAQYRRFLPTGLVPSRDPSRIHRWRGWDENGQPVEPNRFPAARALRGETVVPGLEMLFTDDTGREIWTRLATVPIRTEDGKITGAVTTISDIDSAKRSAEALRESEERLRLIVENARDYAIFTTDPEGICTDWREGAEAVFGYSREEVLGRSCSILFTPEDREHGAPEQERATAATEGRALDVRWHMRKGGVRVFIDGVSTALRDADGALIGFLKIGQDVTERHASEQRQQLLLAELQHRVRNTLGMVRSMVRFTAEGHDDIDDFTAHLVGRLDALARTQVVLTRAAGARVDLESMVWDELEVQAVDEQRVKVTGPNVSLAPKAAEVLSLALHELATNALKYGALSDPAGRLSVRWKMSPRDGETWLRLDWEELSPSARLEPERAGFGTELIQERVPYELSGEASLRIAAHGVKAEIAFPLTDAPSILETTPAEGALP